MGLTAAESDSAVQLAVLHELEQEPDVEHAGIGVAVEAGTVALSGEVDDFAEKLAARNAALRVHGVEVVIDQLSVHSNYDDVPTPVDIAKAVSRALRRIDLPSAVKAVVEATAVVLVGETEWTHQREAAELAVKRVRGVDTIVNRITLVPPDHETPAATNTPHREHTGTSADHAE